MGEIDAGRLAANSAMTRARAYVECVDSALVSLGIDPRYTQVVKGALIIAVTLDQITQEQQERYRKSLAIEERRDAGA